MDGNTHRIDSAAKAKFLDALGRGARLADAADEAGFSLTGFYGARRRDPAFAGAWVEALAGCAAEERRARAYAERGTERGEVRIASANRRFYQRRRRRNVRFDAARREIYLAHLAAHCDSKAAAEAAGVHPSTVTLHRRTDPAFAEAHQAALEEGYTFLEAEAVRQRLAARDRLRALIDAAGDVPPGPLLAEQGAEFDRIMKLLARYDRKPRRPEARFKEGGRRQPWTFERAIVALDKALDAFAVRRGLRPPGEEEGEVDEKGEGA
ncbi:MAG: hypothetical protein ACJ8ER_05330 [Allosphingosinicella sp.]